MTKTLYLTYRSIGRDYRTIRAIVGAAGLARASVTASLETLVAEGVAERSPTYPAGYRVAEKLSHEARILIEQIEVASEIFGETTPADWSGSHELSTALIFLNGHHERDLIDVDLAAPCLLRVIERLGMMDDYLSWREVGFETHRELYPEEVA